MSRVERLLRDAKGQMTVELCVVFPIVIIIAVIATNVLTFFGYCAEFDRASRNAVRTHAASPGYNVSGSDVTGLVQSDLDGIFSADNLSCSVLANKDSKGFVHYKMTLEFAPTLFGMGLRDEVLGIGLPKLTHESRMVVYPYKPGMLF